MSNNQRVRVYDPIHDTVRDIMHARLPKYSTVQHATIFIGTWNLNGKVRMLLQPCDLANSPQTPSEPLLPWLFPHDGS